MRKGRYPGGRKTFIYSEQVWNGGASNRRVGELLGEQKRREEDDLLRKQSRRSSRSKRSSAGKRISGW